jgi:hypothetical protein
MLPLCFLFMFHVFLFHGYNVRFNARYRSLNTHEKINRAYQSLHTCAWGLHIVFPTHHLRKHLAVLSPRSPSMLLWLIKPCPGFDLIITCAWLNPYLGVFVACTYPLSMLQAVVVMGAFYH